MVVANLTGLSANLTAAGQLYPDADSQVIMPFTGIRGAQAREARPGPEPRLGVQSPASVGSDSRINPDEWQGNNQ